MKDENSQKREDSLAGDAIFFLRGISQILVEELSRLSIAVYPNPDTATAPKFLGEFLFPTCAIGAIVGGFIGTALGGGPVGVVLGAIAGPFVVPPCVWIMAALAGTVAFTLMMTAATLDRAVIRPGSHFSSWIARLFSTLPTVMDSFSSSNDSTLGIYNHLKQPRSNSINVASPDIKNTPRDHSDRPRAADKTNDLLSGVASFFKSICCSFDSNEANEGYHPTPKNKQ